MKTATAHEPVDFHAAIFDGDRVRLTVTYPNEPRGRFNPRTYATVRNIDGSNRLMAEGAYWTFFDGDFEFRSAGHAAVAAARGERYPFPHCVPSWARITTGE